MSTATLVAGSEICQDEAMVTQEAPIGELDPREAAAQKIEFIGLNEIADALRGDMDPMRGAKVLIRALCNEEVPSHFKGTKVCPGVMRLAIQAANEAANQRKEALKSAPERVMDLFRSLCLELLELRFQSAGQIVKELKEPDESGVVLIKTLEGMIDEDTEIGQLLAEDAKLAEDVAMVQTGKRATALINALFHRAKLEIADKKVVYQVESRQHHRPAKRIINPQTGFTGRTTGKTAKNGLSLEQRKSRQRANQWARAAKQPVGVKGSKPNPHGKKK